MRRDSSPGHLWSAYREIVRPERIVCTESFDEKWYEGGDALDTMTLTEENGETTLTTTVLAPSKEVRDAVLKSPMAKGVVESYDMLDEVLASIPAQTVK